MNGSELYLFWYNWLTGLFPGVPVIQSHDSGPVPSETFLVIAASGNWTLDGTTPGHLSQDPSYVSPRVFQYRVDMEIREVNGSGDLLRGIVEALDTQDALDLFSANGTSVLKTTGPEFLPALNDSTWRKEQLLRLNMMVARGDSGSDLYIETVETINNLGGT